MASRSLHTRSRAWQGSPGPDNSTTCTRCGVREPANSLQGALVAVVSGSLTGAEGRVSELTTTNDPYRGPGKPAVVLLLTKGADSRVFGDYGAPGDEVLALVSDVEVVKQSPSTFTKLGNVIDQHLISDSDYDNLICKPCQNAILDGGQVFLSENPGRRRERRDQCHALSNKKMDKKVYKERRLIIDQIYRINDLISKAGLPPPPFVGVRVCEKHSRIAGVARLSKNFIWITEDSLKLPPNKLREVVLHELAHAVLGSEHDENCPLMGAILGDTDIPELERAFLDLYAEKVATGWVPESKTRRRRRNPPSSRSLHTRSRAWQGPPGPLGPVKKSGGYLDEAIEAFEDVLNNIYAQQYEWLTEGDGLDGYDFLISDGNWDLEEYYNRGKIDHQYNHDELIDLIIRYVENGPYSYEDLEELIIDEGHGSLYDLKWHEGIFGTYPFTIYSAVGGETEVDIGQIRGKVIDPSTGEESYNNNVVESYAQILTQEELEKVNSDLHVSDFRDNNPVGYINLDGHYAWVAKPNEIEEELDERLERLNDKQLEEALKDPNLDLDLKQLITDELDGRKP